MASRVVMPKLTDTMEEGVVLKWKKDEGDAVATGDVLAEIETDKAVMDLEAFASGVLRRILVKEGETVKAGALIGVIGEADEDIGAALTETFMAGPAPGAVAPSAAAAPPPPRAAPVSAAPALKVSPRARALADDRGIDLTAITGSGPGGRIVERDVRRAAGEGTPRVVQARDIPLSQMRKAIARATIQSKAPVPHFYLTTEIDMNEAERMRAHWKASRRSAPSLTDMIVKAAAIALTRHPEINVSYVGDAIRQHATIDIGIAVGLDDGLITPVLRDCGHQTLEQISTAAHGLIERARTKRLQPHEYTGATFSVSNLGMFDVDSFIAVIMPPEAAALAVGRVREVPVVEANRMRKARRMTVTLSCDHRALDGVQGAKFLATLKNVLEHPLALILPEEA